jgi:triacylglycerol lipase
MNFKKLAVVGSLLMSLGLSLPAQQAQAADAQKTKYPIILAHGMAGWDEIAGLDYFGNELGVFALDGCQLLEVNGCNKDVNGGQLAEAFQVTSLADSETRGTQLADKVQSYMTTKGVSYINLVGHSQGGFDIRKAAHLLKSRKGYTVVNNLISISSPHRGTPYAKKLIDKYALNGTSFCWNLAWNGTPENDPCGVLITKLADVLFDAVNQQSVTTRNNIIAAGKQLVYNDFDPNDGVTTGAKAFNAKYNLKNSAGAYVATRFRSLITAQDDGNRNPVITALHTLLGFNADGDGYCLGDCDNDGAAGKGDGSVYDMDDDGLVGINSQQMGGRLQYNSILGFLDTITETTVTAVDDLNNPPSIAMTSNTGKITQDHLDVVGVGPDTFDELEFYAAINHYIAKSGG